MDKEGVGLGVGAFSKQGTKQRKISSRMRGVRKEKKVEKAVRSIETCRFL